MYQGKHLSYGSERLRSGYADHCYPKPNTGSLLDDSRNSSWKTKPVRALSERRVTFDCYVTNACLEARGLAHPEDCYELCLLRLFCEEYIAKLRGGEAVLAAYRAQAPQVVEAIETRRDARQAYLELFEHYLLRAVALITVGEWDDAYRVCRAMCRDVEDRYLKGATAQSVMEKGTREGYEGRYDKFHRQGYFAEKKEAGEM